MLTDIMLSVFGCWEIRVLSGQLGLLQCVLLVGPRRAWESLYLQRLAAQK